jgi:hypothetical protein
MDRRRQQRRFFNFFKDNYGQLWPRPEPSHGENRGSSPLGSASIIKSLRSEAAAMERKRPGKTRFGPAAVKPTWLKSCHSSCL